MKISKIISLKEHNEERLDNIPVLPVDISIDKIDVSKINSKIIYFKDKERIVGYIETELISYLQEKNSNNMFLNIVEDIEEAVIIIDEFGRIFYANKNYPKILGVPLNKVIGKYIQNIESNASIIEVLKTKKPIIKSNHLIKSIEKYVNVRIYPFFVNNTFAGAYSIFTDVTELNYLNQEVIRISNVASQYNEKLIAQEKLKELKIVGKNKNFLNLITKSLSVAKTDASVLILGENGSGKDILAKFIHKNSKRADEPFIILNCAAIPENLIESEMFGYYAGAFTGAKKTGQVGKFQMADKGTIFLDEVGDMSLSMQAKLLRTLETGEIEKIGGGQNIKVDVRVIAATNQKLERKIEDGSFRQDLFYRLSVVTLELPPLRKRGLDITLFINYFLQKYNLKYNKNLMVSKEAYDILLEYNWPGNIRELKNCIEHCVILANGNSIEIENLPKRLQNIKNKTISTTLQEHVQEKEKEIIENTLRVCNYNINAAKTMLNISERTIYRKIKAYNIILPKVTK